MLQNKYTTLRHTSEAMQINNQEYVWFVDGGQGTTLAKAKVLKIYFTWRNSEQGGFEGMWTGKEKEEQKHKKEANVFEVFYCK